MIEIIDKSECCGCHACYSACPKNAIDMIVDENGFKIPKIKKELCINCGKCDKVCPIKNRDDVKNKPTAYAAYNKDMNIRLKSSSGGIFSLLAEYILNLGGVVFGARFNEKFEVVHDYITRKDDILKFQGSKYVQSIIGNSYKEVKKFLEEGKYVLFTGTPCQVAGLLKYLNKSYDKLYTQDFICHGCPSPKVWSQYLKYQKDLNKIRSIKEINFRNKKNGWSKYSMLINYDGNQYNVSHDTDYFMKAFLSDLCLRDSCYNCKFKGKHRTSDITLADFWGIDNILPEMNQEDFGTSLVIVNSEKGKNTLKKLNEIVIQEVDFEKSVYYNPSYEKSVKKPKNRKKFFMEIDEMDFAQCVNSNTRSPGILKKVFIKLKHFIKKIIYSIKNGYNG